MQQCKEESPAGDRCQQQCTSKTDKTSPTKRMLIDTGRKGWNGEPELGVHYVHDSYYVLSGLCFYHEQIRLGIIDKPKRRL